MNTTFIDACKRRDVDYTPVWFMRQAGRYLPSYMRIRRRKGVFEIVRDPELSSEIAADAVKLLKVDAAIIFSDITTPLVGMGVEFTIKDRSGPMIKEPIRSIDDLERIKGFNAKIHTPFVLESIERLHEKLNESVPVIGFSGAPFTLACYLIEGRMSRDLVRTREVMHKEPSLWHKLMRELTSINKDYIKAQLRAGADAIQLFDSWAGILSQSDYRNYVKDYTRDIFESIPSDIPKIHFCAYSSHLIDDFIDTGCDVLSVDWRVSIDEIWRKNPKVAVQGNLDPVLAVVGGAEMIRGVREIIAKARERKGHIFNLGHGVLPNTPPSNLKEIVKIVHSET